MIDEIEDTFELKSIAGINRQNDSVCLAAQHKCSVQLIHSTWDVVNVNGFTSGLGGEREKDIYR